MVSSAAAAYYVSNSLVRYDPQAAQQARDAAAQQARQQLRAVPSPSQSQLPSEQTLEGELLNKQRQQPQDEAPLSEDEYLSRHQEQYARASRGYLNQSQQAIDAYQSTAQLTHPADVDRVGLLDVYA